MKQIELKRSELVTLHNEMSRYIKEKGKKADKLAGKCDYVMTYVPNLKTIKDHVKKINSAEKELNRKIRNLSNSYAKLYEDGPKKGTFVLDEKGEHVYTVENQNKLNAEADVLYDAQEDILSDIMDEVVTYYIETVTATEIPDALSVDFKDSLSLLIAEPVETPVLNIMD